MRISANVFRALGDETRLRILSLLARRELCVCELTTVLGIGQSKASRHLAVLRNAGLVTDRRNGMWVYYSLAEPEMHLHRAVFEWLARAEGSIPGAAEDRAVLSGLPKGLSRPDGRSTGASHANEADDDKKRKHELEIRGNGGVGAGGGLRRRRLGRKSGGLDAPSESRVVATPGGGTNR